MEWLDIALENLKGIEPFEVVQALAADRRLPRPVIDPMTGLRALTIWARTDAGRPLSVVIRQTGTWDWQIIAAGEMQHSELHEFETWEDS